ncbi:MAG: hypothetical protein LBO05_14355 [Deltaproteobacteria bacterium]|jgi:hypothetical protein|nr:hypothetical protein [Deltaproteobacteria bacterium]
MKKFVVDCLRTSFSAWLMLTKLTIPALLVVRVLMWFDLVGYFSIPFEPLMTFLGLPKELALVWVTAMLANNYTCLLVFLNILPLIDPPTVAQATVLGCLILVSHNLIVEGAVCRGAGVSPLRATLLRVLGAALYGFLIHKACRLFGLGGDQAGLLIPFASADPVPPWDVWLLSNLKSLVFIFLVVTFLVVLMAVMRMIGLIKIVSRIFQPLMRLSGIGDKATMITIIGMVMGLAIGGGLIIAESRSGKIPKNDIFSSITLMNLCHSLFEDTILMASLGGTLWALLLGRIIYSVLMTGLIVRLSKRPRGQSILIGRKYA